MAQCLLHDGRIGLAETGRGDGDRPGKAQGRTNLPKSWHVEPELYEIAQIIPHRKRLVYRLIFCLTLAPAIRELADRSKNLMNKYGR